MKKILLGLVALVAIAAPITLIATPAEAGSNTPGCVSKAEWSKVHSGMSPQRVHDIFGTYGKVTWRYSSGGYYGLTRDYRHCSGPRFEIDVTFYKDPGTSWYVEDKSLNYSAW
jgi:hypothetical protein